MKIHPDALYIIGQLNACGHSAYVVGGCLRDVLLGRPAGDWDIASSALPYQTRVLFEGLGHRVVPTGEAHGTVTVMVGDAPYEVTTYRQDGAYTDGRHPDSVDFCTDIAEDLARRDFTVNAMAYTPVDGLIDPFGGQTDLEQGLLRAVGDPTVRFGEDALRMLRAVRFSCQLGFALEERTKQAICECAQLLLHVSQERIRDELVKALTGSHHENLILFDDCGLTGLILPEIAGFDDELLAAMGRLPADAVLRLAALMSGMEAQTVTDALTRLRFSTSQIRRIAAIAATAPSEFAPELREVKRFLRRHGEDTLESWCELKAARGQSELAVAVRAAYTQIREQDQPYKLSQLAINGSDLLAGGISGKAIGRTLERCLDAVIDDPALNTREALLAIAPKLR